MTKNSVGSIVMSFYGIKFSSRKREIGVGSESSKNFRASASLVETVNILLVFNGPNFACLFLN